jgi:hypothetical protein
MTTKNGIYDPNNTTISRRIQSAVSRPDVVEVKHRLLNGQHHIQTIGTGSTVLDVIAHFTASQKRTLDNIKRTATPLKVIFDGRYYIGLIDGTPEYQRTYAPQGIIFTASFTLLVNEEGAV